MTKESFLYLIVVISWCELSYSKPLSLEMPSPRNQTINHQMPSLRNQTINHQTRAQEPQPQSDAFQPKESISQESGVKNGVNGFLNKAVAHNRTARDAVHPCFSHMQIRWDSCRQDYVAEVHCSSQHVTCQSALAHGYATPACKTVIGYPRAKFISKCAAVQIGCQCAA